jgi:putative phosphoesterase
MPVAAIYDIHANLPALEAVVREIRREAADQIVVGGDIFPGPMPLETIEYLLKLDIPVRFIQGNGDREVMARMRGMPTTVPEQAREAINWNAEQLHCEHEDLIASWPKTITFNIPGLGDVLFCHGTPQSDTQMFTSLTPEDRLLPLFADLNVSVVVCGHTHMQFDRMIGSVRVVNAGSVGMPFGEPGAYWLLLGHGIELRRTSYDLANATDVVRNTKYPQAETFAESNILHPPLERDMLAAFSRVELR